MVVPKMQQILVFFETGAMLSGSKLSRKLASAS